VTYSPDDLHLSVEAGCAAFDQRDVCRNAHLIHVSARIDIVQRVEYKCEALIPLDIELGVFDVGMVGFDLDIGVEFPGGFLCDLVH